MPSPKKQSSKTARLHPRNLHQGRYDFGVLCKTLPALRAHVNVSMLGEPSIDFSDPLAVLCLNRALLAEYYQVQHWMIPTGYLCPPIPGRADVIHDVADLLAESNGGKVPKGRVVRVLDIGTGANCIYPILGSQSYGWKFVGTDIDPVSVKSARLIVEANPSLHKLIKVVQQKQPSAIFKGILRKGESYDLTICNPPFHSSIEAAQAGSQRKVKNLSTASVVKGAAPLNLGGQGAELYCAGGELAFITQMIRESMVYANQVGWFTSLVSKGAHLPALKKMLLRCGVETVREIPMAQGQKISRLLAWRFPAQ